MLALSKKQLMVLLIVLVSLLVIMAASMAILHAANPTLWQQATGTLPGIINGYH